MNEGWFNDEYLILFSEDEIEKYSKNYGIARSLPGYVIFGLRGWDNFLVRDGAGNTYSVPTVPLDKQYLEKLKLPKTVHLKADDRFKARVKWYVKPLVFGGDANAVENLVWVSHEQHVELVIWWNNQYRALKEQQTKNG
jgi:hypothetical protein